MRIFDGYVAVDWSANSKPKRGKDSIWIASRGCGEARDPENPATRAEAVERIEEIMSEATRTEQRLLCGLDFPFGYPEGTAQILTGRSGWEAIWSRIAEVVKDRRDNRNNRFDAAAKLNAAFAGEGPFWGNGLKRDIAGLPRRKPSGWGENLPPNRRRTEEGIKSAQEVWKLSGAGSVGGQALTGIAALESLRHRVGAQVWPFETLGEGRAHVLAEIYPSLIEPDPGPAVKDARQVSAVVAAMERLDKEGALAELLSAPAAAMPPAVCEEEGMILGLRDVEPLWDQIPQSELRALYEGATLSQRYSVAKQRIDDPGGEPNRVVTAVAALEGFARAVAVDYRIRVGESADAAYSELRRETLINLLWNHIVPQIDGGRARLGDRKNWAMLGRAVRFRNLLVHEATFLHGGTARELRRCAEGFLKRLAEAVGVTTRAE